MAKGKGKAKAKYYAVQKGHIPGIYREWEEVEQQINGFPGAIYKSFKLKRDAEFFMKNSEIQDSTMPKNGLEDSRQNHSEDKEGDKENQKTEVESLNDTNNELNYENDRLNSRLNCTTEEHNSYIIANRILNHANNDLKLQVNDMHSEIASLKNEISTYKTNNENQQEYDLHSRAHSLNMQVNNRFDLLKDDQSEEENLNDWVAESRELSHSQQKSFFADHSEMTVRNRKRTENIPSRKQQRNSGEEASELIQEKRQVLIVGDSQLKLVKGEVLSYGKRKVTVRSVSGFRSEKLLNHIEHDTYDNVIIHV